MITVGFWQLCLLRTTAVWRSFSSFSFRPRSKQRLWRRNVQVSPMTDTMKPNTTSKTVIFKRGSGALIKNLKSPEFSQICLQYEKVFPDMYWSERSYYVKDTKTILNQFVFMIWISLQTNILMMTFFVLFCTWSE